MLGFHTQAVQIKEPGLMILGRRGGQKVGLSKGSDHREKKGARKDPR